jgi:hypothetical protein
MKHTWIIDPTDIKKVMSFMDVHRDTLPVWRPFERNLRDDKPAVTKEDFWQQMVACLLTTQQRSGPESAVTRFIKSMPFPLDVHGAVQCRELRQDDLDEVWWVVEDEFARR